VVLLFKRLSGESIKLERVAAIRVASVELTGPYEKWGKGLMELKAWLESKKIAVTGPPIGLFYDNPLDTPPEKLFSEACIPIQQEDIFPEEKYRIKELPAAEIATTRHQGQPEQYTKTYGSFLENLLSQGYRLDGPTREIFGEPSADLSPGKGVLIQQPIKKD